MHSYGPSWEKCSRCGVTHTGVKDGKCTDETLCLRLLTEKIKNDLARLDEPIVGPVDIGVRDSPARKKARRPTSNR